MFYDAASFSYELDKWNVSKVDTMRFMFMYARSFEHKPDWNLDNVKDTVGMFYGTPIVYVSPDQNVYVDTEIEKLAEKESLDWQLKQSNMDDFIEKFAKDVKLIN